MRDDKNFKLLDIKSDCIDMVIASFALWLTGEYRYLFQDCLGFKIDNSQATWGKKIYIDKSDIVTVAIESNELKIIHINKPKLSLENIMELLDCYNPLVLQVDEYYCKWRKNYSKIHRFHYILITGFISETGSFQCVDTYPTNKIVLSFDEILKYSLRVFYIDRADNHSRSKQRKDLLSPSLRKFEERDEYGSVFERTLYFSEEISNNFNYKKEVEGYDNIELIFIPIIWKLKNIVWSWYQFEYFINYINDPHVNTLIKQVKEIQRGWEIITNIIIMRIVKKDNSYMSDSIRKKFNLIVSREQDLAKKISEYSD